MKRKGIILLLSAVLALALTGCQLARETAAPDGKRTTLIRMRSLMQISTQV